MTVMFQACPRSTDRLVGEVREMIIGTPILAALFSISELIRPDEMAIVVVGDADVIRPELEELGMPITELDEDGFEIEGE